MKKASLFACLLSLSFASPLALAEYEYEYYEGNWTQLPDFDSLTPVATGIIPSIDLAVRQRDDQFALRFTGTLLVTAADTYTFGTQSDEGSQLFINGTLVVDNDGLHASTPAQGNIALTPGYHSITVTYFEQTGAQELLVGYGTSTIGPVVLPADGVIGPPLSPLWTLGSWGPVIPWPHVAVSAANLPDGRILTWSGSEPATWPTTEQTYSGTWDPATGEFIEIFHQGHNMFCAHLAMAEDGRVFVNGGRNQRNSPWTSLFDYRDNSWTQIENMASGGRWYPTTIALTDGDMFTAIGTATNQRFPDRWDPESGWQVQNGIDFDAMVLDPYFDSGTHSESRWWPLLHVAPNGKIFHSGPTPQMHWINTTGTGSFETVGSTFTDWYHKHGTTVMYDEGKLLTAGGWIAGGNATSTNQAFTVDLNGPVPIVTNIQPMTHARKFQNGIVLPTGEVLVVGGNTSGQKFSDNGAILEPEFWNPTSGEWRLGAPMTIPRNYHSVALLLVDGRVLAAGSGYNSNSVPASTHQDGQVYSPPYLFNPDGTPATQPVISGGPGNVEVGTTFTVTTSEAVDYFSLIKMSSTTHGMNTDVRLLRPQFANTGGNSYDITLHANPNVATPGYWMLFAVNALGTPSVAEVIRITAVDTRLENRALSGTPSQSSTLVGGLALEATNAIDGDLSGSEGSGSLASTNSDLNAWWEIDLGQHYDIDTLRLWNRTDCCAERLADFYVLVSDQPFVSQDLADTLAQPGVGQFFNPGQAGRQTNLAIGRTARYVRLQLSGQDFLQLAEIQIFGIPADPPPEEELSVTDITTTPEVSGSELTFTANATGPGTLLYSWNFGAGDTPFSSDPSASFRFTEPGRHLITLTVRDGNGNEEQIEFWQLVHLTLTASAPAVSTGVIEYATRGEVWNVNPDNDSVTVIDTAGLSVSTEIPVADEPRGLAIAPDGRVWVTNKGASAITIIDPTDFSTEIVMLDVGAQPHGIAMGPNDAYVVLEATGEVVRMNALTGEILQKSTPIGNRPRHIAIDAGAANLFVSLFVTPTLPGEGTASPVVDDGTNLFGGEVLVLDPATLATLSTVVLRHSDELVSEHSGPGLPNYVGPAVISPDGTAAWVPSKQDNVLAGDLRGGQGMTFDQTVRAVTSRILLPGNTEDFPMRIDHDNASVSSYAAFDRNGLFVFTALEGNRQVAVSDAHTGVELLRFAVGRAPQALAVSGDGGRLYVHNFMDRSVGIYDISALVESGKIEVTEVATVSTVSVESLAPDVLLGKQLFYDAADDRLAALDYMSCASCHNEGSDDGRVWDFTGVGEGLRNTVSLNGRAGMGHGFLHWSANFDEVQDFEAQIRDFSGGTGLMDDADFNAGTRSEPLGDPKAGLSADLDALAAYVASLDSIPASPHRGLDGELSADAQAGSELFDSEGCAGCHTLTSLTDSSDGDGLHDVGTIKASSGNRLGGPLNGIDTPTLLGAWRTGPYLHDGSELTLQSAISAHQGVFLSDTQLDQLAALIRELDDGAELLPPEPPAIVTQPAPQSVEEGSPATFSVAATGEAPLSYQWRRNGVDMPGEVSDTLTLAATTLAENGDAFDVVVSNDGGSVTSAAATLTVTATPPEPTITITLAQCGPGGAEITGTTTGIPDGSVIALSSGPSSESVVVTDNAFALAMPGPLPACPPSVTATYGTVSVTSPITPVP